MTNYYNILGVESNADSKDIKVAYRKLSKKFHPDLNPDEPFFHKMFLQIQEAHDVLSDEQLRLEYDQALFKINTARTEITPNSKSDAPTIENFSVDKDRISANEIFTLTWKVENADIVQIRPIGLFPLEGFDTFKFNRIKGESINLILIATNTATGQSARQHIVLNNADWKPSLLENNHIADILIIVLKVIFIALILITFILIFIYGIQVNDPNQEL